MAITQEDRVKIQKMIDMGISQRRTAASLGIPKSTLNDYIVGKTYKRSRYPWQVDPKTIKEVDRVVGVISDVHAPSHHPDTIPFLIKTFKDRGVNVVISTGDLMDCHRSSNYINEQDSLNFVDEYAAATSFIKELVKVFPYAYLCTSNHDGRNLSKAKANGIDLQALKPLHDYLGLPDGWVIKDKFIVGGVKYCHKSRMGAHGVFNAAKELGGSLVSAHTHIALGVRYHNNMYGSFFSMDVGCTIDADNYAMRYAAEMNGGLTLGTGVVYNRYRAEAIPMVQGDTYE